MVDEIRKLEKGNVEQDHFPEEAFKANRRIEVLGLSEQLRSSDTRRSFFGGLSDEGYRKILGYINSIMRRKTLEYDYKGGYLPTMVVPEKEEKELLMLKAFETVRNILGNDTLDDPTALRIASLALAGAVSYIHPYDNGNGRVGRIMHYLMEFGNQRGDKALSEELYAIIAKLPMYNTDRAQALYNTPPPELDDAIHAYIIDNHLREKFGDDVSYAAVKVEIFLQMMQGITHVPTNKRIRLSNLIDVPTNMVAKKEDIPAGQIDGRSLYIREYLNRSTVPHRKPAEIPSGAARVLAKRKDKPSETIYLPIDIVE